MKLSPFLSLGLLLLLAPSASASELKPHTIKRQEQSVEQQIPTVKKQKTVTVKEEHVVKKTEAPASSLTLTNTLLGMGSGIVGIATLLTTIMRLKSVIPAEKNKTYDEILPVYLTAITHGYIAIHAFSKAHSFLTQTHKSR
ncbi:hypothetical protein H0X06_03795 [Candidatus Dependentiae bacterium]|nr:hypothetical protein [Candidatus Dependentiae bacterium]